MNLDASIDSPQTDTLHLGPAGSDCACLLIHGFTGTPWDLQPLAEALAKRGYRVLVPRLPGHGTTPRALSQVTHLDWQRAAEESLLALHHAPKVMIAGFSMGALLSVLLCAKFPERVAALGLMAPALRLSGTRMALLRRLRHLPILETFQPYLDKNGADLEDPAVRAVIPTLNAFPAAKLKDLWRLQDKAWQVLPRIRAPIWLGMAKEDHVVPLRAGEDLLRRLPRETSVRSVLLTRGYHNVIRDRAGPIAIAELLAFFEHHRGR